jgi:hypothetical protein
VQAERPPGFRYEYLTAGRNSDSSLEFGSPGFEVTSFYPQRMQSTRGVKGDGLAGGDGQRAPQKNEEPQQYPVPSLKPYCQQ